MPQKRGIPADGITDPPGSATQPVWRMGGTDGPFARVDPSTGRVFYTIGVAGNVPALSARGLRQGQDANRGPFILSDEFINRTAVVMSDDRGETWQPATSLPF